MPPFIRYLSLTIAVIWIILVISLVVAGVYTVITHMPLLILTPIVVCLGFAAFIFWCMTKWEW